MIEYTTVAIFATSEHQPPVFEQKLQQSGLVHPGTPRSNLID